MRDPTASPMGLGPQASSALRAARPACLRPLHRHGADTQLLTDMAEALALQQRQPDDRGLGRREPIQQGLDALATGLARLLGCLQLIDPEITAGHRGMQALVAPGVAALLVLTPRDADQAAVITEVVEQGALDAAPEIAGGRGWIADLLAGEPELHLGHLAGILQLNHAAAGR